MDDSFLYDFINTEENKKPSSLVWGKRLIDVTHLNENDQKIIKFVEQYFTVIGMMREKAVTEKRENLFPLLFDEDQVLTILLLLDEHLGMDNPISQSLRQQISARLLTLITLMGENMYGSPR